MANKMLQRDIRYAIKPINGGFSFTPVYKRYQGMIEAWYNYVDYLDLDYIGWSEGVNGVNGVLFYSNTLGQYCGVVGRPTVMYTLPWA